VGSAVDRFTDVEGMIVTAHIGSITELEFLTKTSRGMAYRVTIRTPGMGLILRGVIVQTGPGEGLLYEGLTGIPSGPRTRRHDPSKMNPFVDEDLYPQEIPVQDNPFYVSLKQEGQDIERMGPMSELDLWVEDTGDLEPLFTSADPTYEEIGQLLRERRLELGLRTKDVAGIAGIARSSINDMENARTRARIPVLKAFAKALGAYFEGPLPDPRRAKGNPDEFEVAVENYRIFHGVDPEGYLDMNIWVPGEMIIVGVGKDVGYGILNKYSHKDGWYVHDFGPKVKIYRRAKSGERADRTWRNFPRTVTNMGHNLGFTYLKGGVDGPMKEVKGAENKYLAFTPSRRTIVVVGPRGIEYLMEGGNMRVDNWIRD